MSVNVPRTRLALEMSAEPVPWRLASLIRGNCRHQKYHACLKLVIFIQYDFFLTWY